MSDACEYFLPGPEPSSVKLVVVRGDGSAVRSPVDIYQFSLAAALEDVAAEELVREGCYAEFLADLAAECLCDGLAVGYVSSAGGVPFAGLYVLSCGWVLEVEVALGVEDVQVDYGMQGHAAAVCVATRDAAGYVSLLIDCGEHLFGVVSPGSVHNCPMNVRQSQKCASSWSGLSLNMPYSALPLPLICA